MRPRPLKAATLGHWSSPFCSAGRAHISANMRPGAGRCKAYASASGFDSRPTAFGYKTGKLYYDADCKDGAAAARFATLSNHSVLSHGDFAIV